jgi:hypothetical protein
MAAAFNTLIAFVIFYAVTQKLSNRYLKIEYENYKIFIMVLTGSVLSLPIYFFPAMNVILAGSVKLLLVILYPVFLYFFNFYEKAELEILLSPAKLIEFAKGIVKGTTNTETFEGTRGLQ